MESRPTTSEIRTPSPPPRAGSDPTTPPRSLLRHRGSLIGSPSGSMSTTRLRKPPPAFPDSPRAPPPSSFTIVHKRFPSPPPPEHGSPALVSPTPPRRRSSDTRMAVPSLMHPNLAQRPLPTPSSASTSTSTSSPTVGLRRSLSKPSKTKSREHKSAQRYLVSPGLLTAPYSPYRRRGSEAALGPPHALVDHPFTPGFPPASAYSLNNGTGSGGKDVTVLRNVQQRWVVNELRKNSGLVWNRVETSDCRVFVPIPKKFQEPVDQEAISDGDGDVAGTGSPPLTPRRMRNFKGVIYPLHYDYLITQSAPLRRLLTPEVRMVGEASCVHPPTPSSPRERERGGGLAGSHIMAGEGKVGNPTLLFLNVPDPDSFPMVVHWMYWGDEHAIRTALTSGQCTWSGMCRNIAYLDLTDEIRRIVGEYWAKWVKPGRGRARPTGEGDQADTRRAGEGGENGEESGLEETGEEGGRERAMDVDEGWTELAAKGGGKKGDAEGQVEGGVDDAADFLSVSVGMERTASGSSEASTAGVRRLLGGLSA